jgi:ornithine cyclodeaminase/alanine dehydrogenase-like protein (mu-crystallin family)
MFDLLTLDRKTLSQPIKIFSEKIILAHLTMRECIKVMQKAFGMLSVRGIHAPQRSVVPTIGNAQMLIMPAYSPTLGFSSVKLVTITPENATRGMPYIQATVMLYDAESGRLMAIFNGDTITNLRTGAASGLATSLLAREDARTVAIFGTGVQAVYQLMAVCAVRPIQKVYVFSRNAERGHNFATQMSNQLGVSVRVAPSIDLLHRVDIICTATPATSPLFSNNDIGKGVHINAIGAYKPDMQEIPPETVRRAVVVVDQRKAALSEAGDIIIPLKKGIITEQHIVAELGEIVDMQSPLRKNHQQITLFKSVGHAAQDLILAVHLWQKIKEDKSLNYLELL